MLIATKIPVYAEDTPAAAPLDTPAEDSTVVKRNPFVPQLPLELLEEAEVTTETAPTETPTPSIGPGSESASTSTTTTTESTVPQEKPILGNPTLVVSGILWNSDRPQAIVNGNIIEIGDKMFSVPTDQGETIEQVEFVAISKEGVSVAFKDKTVVVNSGLEPPKGAQR